MNLKFKFPAQNILLLLAGNSNFKLRIVFWNIFFEVWRSKKHIPLSEKKPPLKASALSYYFYNAFGNLVK